MIRKIVHRGGALAMVEDGYGVLCFRAMGIPGLTSDGFEQRGTLNCYANLCAAFRVVEKTREVRKSKRVSRVIETRYACCINMPHEADGTPAIIGEIVEEEETR